MLGESIILRNIFWSCFLACSLLKINLNLDIIFNLHLILFDDMVLSTYLGFKASTKNRKDSSSTIEKGWLSHIINFLRASSILRFYSLSRVYFGKSDLLSSWPTQSLWNRFRWSLRLDVPPPVEYDRPHKTHLALFTSSSFSKKFHTSDFRFGMSNVMEDSFIIKCTINKDTLLSEIRGTDTFFWGGGRSFLRVFSNYLEFPRMKILIIFV